MNYSFHPEAKKELEEAADYLEKQRRGLGFKFSTEVYKSIQRINENPRSWTKISEYLRRILVQRFPYGILYHYDSESFHIYIVAIMHLRRKPEYWKNRV